MAQYGQTQSEQSRSQKLFSCFIVIGQKEKFYYQGLKDNLKPTIKSLLKVYVV